MEEKTIDYIKSSSLAGKFKFLLKDSFIYGGLNALSKFFSLFLTPLLTRLLTKEEYGNIDVFNPIIAIVGTLIVFGMDSAVVRFYYNTTDEIEKRKIVSNGFWIQVIVCIVAVIVLYVIKYSLVQWYFGGSYEKSQIRYIDAIIWIIVLTTPMRFAQNLLRWLFRRKEFLIISIGYIVFSFVGICIMVNIHSDKVYGVFLGQIFPALLFSVVSLIYIWKYIDLRIDKKLLIPMLKYGMPLVIMAFIPAFIPSLDRFFINKYLGLASVANYGIGYRFASLIAIPILSINTAIGPFILALYKESNAQRLFNLLTYVIIVVISASIMLLVIIAPYLIPLIATKSYMAGLLVVAPLSFNFLVEMLRSISGAGIDLSMKTYWNLILYPFGVLILYVLLIVITPRFGIEGTANCLLIASVVNFISFTIVGTRLYPLQYSIWKKLFILAIAYFISLIIVWLQGPVVNTLISLLLIISFVGISYFVILSKDDRERVMQFVLRKKA